MIAQEQEIIERSGAVFHEEGIKRARDLTWEAIARIRERIHVGMTEGDAVKLAQSVLEEMGTKKFWHRSLVRFGENTLDLFDQPLRPETVLRENDIFFLDLGPVWDGFEGDSGETFVVGNDEEMRRCASDCKKLFELVANEWRVGATGGMLYDFAIEKAQAMGWILNLGSNGHRVSDFPHKIHFKGSVQELAFSPSSCRWILEIQIRHPQLPFGAFHEDLLV